MGQRKALRSSAVFSIRRLLESSSSRPSNAILVAASRRSPTTGSRSLIGFSIAIGVLLGAVPLDLAAAQAEASASPAVASQPGNSVCEVLTTDVLGSPIGTAEQVVAHCGGHGLILGHADAFEVVSNKELGAVLVDLRRGSERRLLLISLQENGAPLLEDISGQIAMRAGRGPTGSLDGIQIDLAGFAGDSAIDLRTRGGGAAGASTTDRIHLGAQIANARTYRGDKSAAD